MKNTNGKTSVGVKWAITIGVLAILLLGVMAFRMSVSGEGGLINGGEDQDWSGRVVNLKLNTYDKYTSSDESATAKVYEVKPADWGNPRGDFTDAKLYTSYSASSGVVTINKEYPGTYYVVVTTSGSNTEFVEIEIPTGAGISDSLSDYNSAPYSFNVPISAVGSTTDEDFAFTLVNGTSQDVKDTITLTVDSSTELRGWKAIISDEEGFSIDADGDGIYDEGIKEYKVIICGKTETLFKPATGIDLFDSNDEYTLDLSSCNAEDTEDVSIRVEIVANTGDYTGANDEVWGEGEGVLSYIKIYDNEGNLFSTTDVTA